jgi:hypothetical protein
MKLSNKNLQETKEFVNFCHQNKLLANFLDIYPQFNDFQPNISSELFVIHPQRTALLRMKYKERFNNEVFVNAIKFMIASMSALKTLKESNK